MKLEDYNKYYIQGSDHYLIPKDEFVELFNEMTNWKKETKKLKRQLNYIRSGEYYKQLRFENEMLQQVVDTNGVPSEVYDYLECLHMNTELIEKNNRLNEQLKLYVGGLKREHEATKRAYDLEVKNKKLKEQLQQANDILDTHNELIDNLVEKVEKNKNE